MSHDDFDFEPVKGLPAHLPEGEAMVWQGEPGFFNLAIRAFHVRKVAIYFSALALWRFFAARGEGQDVAGALGHALGLLPPAVLAIVILCGLAWGYSRSTVYTLTNRRLVIRSGIALPITLNLPFSRIETALLRTYRGGEGDLVIEVEKAGDRIPALVVWPHMRPWSWNHPQPMLRGLKDAAHVANLLGKGLQGQGVVRAVAEAESPAAYPQPAASPVHG
jgi:Bacterial PH domain